MTSLIFRFTTLTLIVGMAVAFEAQAQEAPVAILSGIVIDGLTADPIRGAQVEILGTDKTANTDLDGRFVLSTTPGTYGIRASLDGYFPYELEALELAAGELPVELVLVEEQVVTEEITVTAPTIQAATEAAVLVERRSAPTVSDAISAQEISGNGDSDAAGAMSRVVGASLMDDKYLFVRGLGDRYMSTTQLNGSLLASTEADKKVVPLDLFPASLVDSIKLEKTYTPDRPGEFSGALVTIDTVEFPTQPTLKVSYSSGFNSLTTFKDYMTYPGGAYDWAGFGDSRRNLPSTIPFSKITTYSPYTGSGFTAAQREQFGESFENVWNPVIQRARPNHSFNVLAGNTWGRLGVVYGLSYGNKLQNEDSIQNYYRKGITGAVTPWHTYTMSRSSNSVRLGSTLNFAYKLGINHKIQFRTFFSKDAGDEARIYSGYNDDASRDIYDQRLRFIEEAVYSGQLSGDHYLTGLNALLEWRLAYNRADRDEPDIREVLYWYNDSTQQFEFRDQTQSGLRQYIASSDKIWEPGIDFTKFFDAGAFTGSFKIGALYTQRDRYFDSRRFRFTRMAGTGTFDFTQDPESLFTPDNIGTVFDLFENTRVTDHYLGDHDVKAGYGMVDLYFGSGWRVIGGLRMEKSLQSLNSSDLFAIDPTTIQTRLDDTDYLPSVNVVYSVTSRQNIRAGYSRTVTRPNFRELAPFDFTDVTGGSTVVGNEKLTRTAIDNYDLRWEMFLGPTELVSASFFYKDFTNPIETILQPTAQIRTTYANVESARNWGIETEIRKNLVGLSPSLQPFTVSANYTFVSSDETIGDEAAQEYLSIVTSSQRPLTGQSRNVFNGSLEYNNPRWWGHTSRLLYNMVGRRITGIAALGVPDIYQEAQHMLDLVVQQRISETSPIELKFSVSNILDDPKEYTQGGFPYHVYNEGRTYSVGLSYDIF